MTDAHVSYAVPITALVMMVLTVGIVLWNERGENIGEISQVERGRTIYQRLCAASCHHLDPNKEIGTDGTYGPPIAGSPLPLLTMRVRSVEYPEGYTPKRTSSLMTTFELTDTSLLQLHAFLTDAAAKAAGK